MEETTQRYPTDEEAAAARARIEARRLAAMSEDERIVELHKKRVQKEREEEADRLYPRWAIAIAVLAAMVLAAPQCPVPGL